MAEKRRGLGRGIGALIPESQEEKQQRPIDVFFSSPSARSSTKNSSYADVDQGSTLHAGSAQSSTAGNASSVGSRKKATASPQKKAVVSRTTSARKTATAIHTDDNTELVPVPGATFGELNVSAIIPNTKQPRQVFDEDDLQELADSIAEVGVLQPIVVRPLRAPLSDQPDARYELIMGERRWRATQRAGLSTIPAIVRHTDDTDLLRDALLENLHRAQLNPLEEAAAYQQLLDDFKITHEELSKKIARSRPQITNTLRLLKLPPLVQRRVAAGVLSAGHARALLSLADPAAMERLAQRIVAEGLSVRAIEEIVAVGGGSAEPKSRASRTQRYVAELNELAVRLGDRFDTRVKVQMGSHKGRITIEFAEIDDLNRILSEIGDAGVDVNQE